jgi:hypothetical protein
MSNLQINQFQQVPVLGQVEMEPLQTGTLSCQVSPNQATALVSGQRVTLDTTITVGPGKPPQIISGGGTSKCIGVVIHSAKQDSFNALDMVEIAYFGGPIIWLLNTAVAIAPGADCEDNGAAPGLMQVTSGGNTKIAVALDYIPASTLGRYILMGVAALTL